MKKQTKNISRVLPENSRKQHSQVFSVSKIISSKGVVVDTTDEAFSGGITLDLTWLRKRK